MESDVSGLRYRMPRVPRDAGTAYRFISANERRQLPKPCQSYQYRSRIGVNIAEALRGLHATHVRIGDVNPSNILVDDDGAVTLIDCDSFQIPGPPGRQPYPCVVGSPEYTAPEINDFQRQFRSQDSDNFALAVLLYHCWATVAIRSRGSMPRRETPFPTYVSGSSSTGLRISPWEAVGSPRRDRPAAGEQWR